MVTCFAVPFFFNYLIHVSSLLGTRVYDSKIFENFLEALNETSFACQVTLQYCHDQYPDAEDKYQQRRICDYLKLIRDNVTLYDCLASAGFCTVNEANNLTNVACQEKNSILLALGEMTSNFYKALYTTSEDCVRHLLACIESYVVALIYKMQESFCNLLDIRFDHYFCYKSPVSCSEEEVEVLTHRSCIMPLLYDYNEITTDSTERREPHFSDMLSSFSNSCLWSFHMCFSYDTSFLRPYLFSHRYCDLVGVISLRNQSFKECLVDTGLCSPNEYLDMYMCACSRATIFRALWIYILPLLIKIFLNEFLLKA